MTADITARITTTPSAGFGALTSPKVRSILARTDIPRPAFRSRLYLCSHAASIPCFVDASKAAHFEGAPSSASFEGQHAMTPPWSLISLRADSRDLPFQHVMRQRCDQRKGAGIDFCRSPVQCETYQNYRSFLKRRPPRDEYTCMQQHRCSWGSANTARPHTWWLAN